MNTRPILVHSEDYANWVFDPRHPTQGRRFINAKNLFYSISEVETIPSRPAKYDELKRAHSQEHIERVLIDGESGEWLGSRQDLAKIASLFVGGTLVALEQLLNNKTLTAIHFPGAKHHAQKNRSSGFCVFADFAIAADIATKDFGKKVAIIDIDAHHGDGTENLTINNPDVLSYSIHEYGIFPGTGYESYPEQSAYNYALGLNDLEKTDDALLRGVNDFIEKAKAFNPALIFIACGADGHAEDPLSNLLYSVEGYKAVALLLSESFPNTPFLMGGAGGYLPDSRTPEVWANFAATISSRL